MLKRYITGIIVCVVVCWGAVAGAETEGNGSRDFSLRISLGSAPGVDEVDIDGVGSASIDSDGGGRLELLAVKRFYSDADSEIGGMFGGGVFFAGHSGEDVDISAFGVMIQGGLAARPSDTVTVEVGPYLGVGSAQNEVTGFSDGRGPYYFAGIKGGVFVALSENFELGLEVGYEGFAQDQEFDTGGGPLDTTFYGDSLRAAGVLVFCF